MLTPVDLPDPVPRPGEVVVRTGAIHTIFVKTQIRKGVGAGWFGIEVPYVPGGSAAGTVVAVGPQVPSWWLGRRVLVGAQVVGAARGSAKLGLIAKLGARPVDYSQPGWTEAVRDAFGGEPVDLLLDGVGGTLGSQGVELVADDGLGVPP